MHHQFLCCQRMFCCFSVKNMGCKPTLCLLFCRVVYLICISNHGLLLSGCVQFWCCVIECALVTRPHLKNLQPGEFPHICLIATILLMHHAGPSSSTLYPSIILDWRDKQQPEAWLNESKYLWNVLMCPFVLHAVHLIVVSDWRLQIIESS